VRKLGSDYFVAGGIPKAAAADLLQSNYLELAIQKIALATPGLEAYADTARFNVVQTPEGGSRVGTNIDFAAVNARRRKLNPALDPITEAHLASSFLDATGDTLLAAHYGGEFYTSAMTSDVVRIRYGELLKRAGISAAELTELKDVVLADYPTIREVINARARTFDEF